MFTLDEYVDAGILTAAQAEVLRAAVAAKQNILVSGATASGKTTFVNALLAEIARTDDRVFIVEDIPELQCASPNRVQYHVQPPFTTRLAIMDALRSRPDRIVVGEVREGGAALELIKAWNTGHPGGTGTLHANDNRQALNRLCQLIEEVAQRAPREIIAETVNVCVHIRRDPRARLADASRAWTSCAVSPRTALGTLYRSSVCATWRSCSEDRESRPSTPAPSVPVSIGLDEFGRVRRRLIVVCPRASRSGR